MLQRPEQRAESNVLLVADHRAADDADRVAVHRGLDVAEGRGVDAFGEVEARDFRREHRMERVDPELGFNGVHGQSALMLYLRAAALKASPSEAMSWRSCSGVPVRIRKPSAFSRFTTSGACEARTNSWLRRD